MHERKEAARLAALKPTQEKPSSFLSASFSALRQRFSGVEVETTSFENPMLDKGVKDSSKKKRRLSSRELMREMSSQHLQTNTQETKEGKGEGQRGEGVEGKGGEEGEEVTVTLEINPTHATRGGTAATAPETTTPHAARATRASRMFRNGGTQRMKRLSRVMKARQNHESDVETVVSMHVDEETGRRYRYDEATGQTQWLSDDDDESEATYEEAGESESKQKTKTLFRKFVDDDDDAYYENVETGEVVWDLPKEGELVE